MEEEKGKNSIVNMEKVQTCLNALGTNLVKEEHETEQGEAHKTASKWWQGPWSKRHPENEARMADNVFKFRILLARFWHSHLASSIFSAKQDMSLSM